MNLRFRSALVVMIAAALVAVPVAGAVAPSGGAPGEAALDVAVVDRADVSDLDSSAQPDGEWVEYNTIAMFRNDDVTAHWRTQARKDVDRVFVEEDVPVTVGVVPAHGEGNPVNSDGEFCNYVRDLREDHGDVFEFSQHGYTHEMISDWKGASEFGGLSYETQHERVTGGKEAFEDCVGTTPTTFIPPGNTYDRTTVEVLNDEGFDVVSGSSIVADEFGNSGVFEQGGLNHAMMTVGMVEDWNTPVTFHSRSELRYNFDRAYENGDVYVQMLHFQHFTSQERLDKLRWLIQYMKSKDGVRFMTIGEFSQRLDNGTVERTADGWRVRESAPASEPELDENGQVTATLEEGEQHVYTYELEERSTLEVETTGDGDTDFDLYLTIDGRTPTPGDYDHRSFTYGTDESLAVDYEVDGEVGVMVDSYSGSGEYTLTVTETAGDDDGGGGGGDDGDDDGDDDDCAWWQFWCWFS